MEANVVGAKEFPKGVGKQVFAAMLLHVVQTGLPVDDGLDLGTHREGCLAVVNNFPVPFLDIRHGRPIECARVAQLAAPFGKENRPVQDDGVAVRRAFTGRDRRVAFLQKRVALI